MKTLIRYIAGITVAAVVATSQPAGAGAGRIVTGADSSAGGPHVKAFTTRTHTNVSSFFAYTPSFTGGVRVATGDVNGDGAADMIAGSGPGAAHLRVFSGRGLSELYSFLPYGSGFTGGIYVAAGDVNGDGFDDIVTGTDAGVGPHVKVFSGASGSEIRSFFAYPVGFTGGVRVATGDINGDGHADIITGTGAGSGPHVKVFDGINSAEIRSFFAYSVSFTGGVFVAAGDINGDGQTDVITSTDSGAAPHVKAFHGGTQAELQSFFAYPAQFSGGVRVASGDVNGDGRDEIMTTPGNGASPQLRVFDGLTGGETASFLAYPANFTNGVFVAAASVSRPRLEIQATRAPQEIQLQWPSGCLCLLESSTNAANPQSWSVLDVQPVENGNRMGLLLPAVQKVRFFRLNCDDETVR